jgi:GT2 family glycosyltransferase
LRGPYVGAVGAPYEAPRDGTWVQRTYDLLRRRRTGLHEVEWLGSGNLAVWRRSFDAIGGFDTTLQTCEDVDFCRRLRSDGTRILESGRLRSVHLGDPSTVSELFRGELWRGRDNLRASLRGTVRLRELPSIIVPVVHLVARALALVRRVGHDVRRKAGR